MTDVIRQHLHRAKQRMKKNADEHRLERQFLVNDLVYVKIQPYIQSSLAQHANKKLSFKFFGPYRVLARVRSVAYRLELPASSSVHPVCCLSDNGNTRHRSWGWADATEKVHQSANAEQACDRRRLDRGVINQLSAAYIYVIGMRERIIYDKHCNKLAPSASFV